MREGNQAMISSSDKMHLIRSNLECRAEKGLTITFDDLGGQIGRRARGPWPELDAIYEEDKITGRPDLTLCVVSADTSVPPKYLGQTLELKDRDRINQYFNDLARLFVYYGQKNGTVEVIWLEPTGEVP